MTAPLHTRDAVEEYLRVREELFRTMRADRGNGVAAHEIARTAAGTYSPPVILAYLSRVELRDEARAALRRAGLDRCAGVRCTGAGRAPGRVLLALTRDPMELSPGERRTLPQRLADTLRRAAIGLRTTGGKTLPELLCSGEEIPLHRT